MRLTVTDVVYKNFRRELFGFSKEEVYAFLEIVRDELDALDRERSLLIARIDSYERGQTKERRIEELVLEFIRKFGELRVGGS